MQMQPNKKNSTILELQKNQHHLHNDFIEIINKLSHCNQTFKTEAFSLDFSPEKKHDIKNFFIVHAEDFETSIKKLHAIHKELIKLITNLTDSNTLFDTEASALYEECNKRLEIINQFVSLTTLLKNQIASLKEIKMHYFHLYNNQLNFNKNNMRQVETMRALLEQHFSLVNTVKNQRISKRKQKEFIKLNTKQLKLINNLKNKLQCQNEIFIKKKSNKSLLFKLILFYKKYKNGEIPIRIFPLPKSGELNQHQPRPLKIPNHYYKKTFSKELPGISIVPPCYNQGAYLERTIKNIHDQEYPLLEYIVQNGVSSNTTISILKKYTSAIKYWESRLDTGRSTKAFFLDYSPEKKHDIINFFVSHAEYFDNLIKKLHTSHEELIKLITNLTDCNTLFDTEVATLYEECDKRLKIITKFVNLTTLLKNKIAFLKKKKAQYLYLFINQLYFNKKSMCKIETMRALLEQSSSLLNTVKNQKISKNKQKEFIKSNTKQLKLIYYLMNKFQFQNKTLTNKKSHKSLHLLKSILFFNKYKKLLIRIKIFFRPKLGELNQYHPSPLKILDRYYKKNFSKELPVISIVTPSFNQGIFIERTIKSVLEQKYASLEYIIQDGNSSDKTLEIFKKYACSIKHWESRTDDGQSNAINLGFHHATGDIMAYLNSDDILLPGSLHYIGNFFLKNPDVDVIYGHRIIIDTNDHEIGRWVLPPHESSVLYWADFIPQETLFWRKKIWEKAGSHINESFRFAMDWDLILRFIDAKAKFVRLPRFLGAFRIHSAQKTSLEINKLGMEEMKNIRYRLHHRHVSHMEITKMIHPYLKKHLVYHNLYRAGILRY